MTSLLLLSVMLFASSASAQQHAPTVEVCRADYAVWNAEIEHTSRETTMKRLSLNELIARYSEMAGCLQVELAILDASNFHELLRVSKYEILSGAYLSEIAGRQEHFIDRHKMWQQLLDEDAAGAR
jgi:hypothetical protein